MKRNIFKQGSIVLVFFSFAFFTACEREVILDIPEQKQLVAFVNFSPDSIFRLHLSTAVPLNTPIGQFPEFPENADIQLTEDGKSIGAFTFQKQDIYSGLSPSYFLNHRAKPNSQYTLSINVPDYPEVTAENKTPALIEIQGWSVLSQNIRVFPDYDELFSVMLETQVEVAVPPSTSGYYHLVLWQKTKVYELLGMDTVIFDSYVEEVAFSLPSTVPHLAIFHELGVLVDYRRGTSGTQKIDLNFSFDYDTSFELKPSFVLELRAVSEDYYRFHKSVGEQEVSSLKSSALSLQSSLIYNNLNGGIGNFSSYVSAVDSLDW